MKSTVTYDQDLLNLFSQMIENENEKLILELLFTKRNTEELLDELIEKLEHSHDD